MVKEKRDAGVEDNSWGEGGGMCCVLCCLEQVRRWWVALEIGSLFTPNFSGVCLSFEAGLLRGRFSLHSEQCQHM
jgi:hypothetical protein